MHREISHASRAFHQESNLTLFLLTGLLALIVGADVWPAIASWEPVRSWGLPTWPREFYGYRLALFAAVLGGARTLYGSLNSLLDGRIGADLALAIAAVAAILVGEPLVAAEVVLVGMLGECLESITFERTQRAVRQLAELFPIRCWLLRDGQEVRVLVEEVQVGDRVVVKPGAKVPVDGVVVEGRSALNLAALTGESLPVEKGPGEEVLAGALNGHGALTIETRRVREQTVAGRVIEMTVRALQDKAPAERTADRLARWFLPAVLAVAAVTFLVGLIYHGTGLFRPAGSEVLGLGRAVRLSVYPTLSVLVVACPCALILATPAAVIAALGRLAGTGILIKGGSALERLAGVQTVAFDKTGTLTEGRLELGEVLSPSGLPADEVLRLAAAAEARSEHLLARLIVQTAEARGLCPEPVEEFLAHPGGGVTCRLGGQTLIVGTPRLVEEQGVPVSPEVVERLGQLDALGQTALLVAQGGQVVGVVGARDRVRPEAKSVLAELRSLGLGDLVVLTGDRPAAAQAAAEGLGPVEVHAGLLPQQKAEFVRERRQAGRRVAVIGDGINDAPALAGADVGLAVSGIEAVAEAGDIVLMGDPLRHLPLLIRLSRETVRVIRQNILFFAFGVNALGILVTAWLWPLVAPAGWYEQGPLAAVLYHQLGSLAVLLNAMRLLGFERTSTSPTWQRWRGNVAAFNARMDRLLDTHEALHWVAAHWRQLTAILVLMTLVAYGLTGLTQVEAAEIAVVRRFGRPLPEDLGPGLHWTWPWPVEEVTRVRPAEIRTLEIGFRTAAGMALPASLTWSSPHGGDGLRRVEEEAVMITGDGNLVEVQATLRYSLSHPRVTLFEVSDPETILRAVAESVLREAVASRPFGELLTVDRHRFSVEVIQRLRERCQQYGPEGLGLRLDGLALHDLHPPQEVVPSYHDVTRAMEARDRQVNQAQADVQFNPRTLIQSAQLWRQADRDGGRSGLSLAEAHALALQAVRQAEAERAERVHVAEANRDVFVLRDRARTSLGWRVELRLLSDCYSAARAGQTSTIARDNYLRRRRDLQQAQVALTDFRIYWSALGKALAGREKFLIDADKIPGRRQLLLMDPDQFRVPVPVLTPPDRAPLRSNRADLPEGP